MTRTFLDTQRLREMVLMDPQFSKLPNMPLHDNEHWGEKEELSSQSLTAKHRGNERNIAFSREIKFP